VTDEIARVAILGPMRITRSGRTQEISAAKIRAVLALLAIEPNRPIQADRLVAELWPGCEPQAPRKTLQGYIWRLRRMLGRGQLRTTSGGYQLVSERENVDASWFEELVRVGRHQLSAGRPAAARDHLCAALALWRGPALVDVPDVAGVGAYASRLEETRLLATEARIDAELALGGHAEVVPPLLELTANHPVRETMHARLMIALFRCGRQADALAVYAELRASLVDGQGLEPSTALIQLHQRILAGDPHLELPGA
jgi:DNA-binding SARP family transcriptional activator